MAAAAWKPNPELKAVLDTARAGYRQLYADSEISGLSLEDHISAVKAEGMYFSNMYERRDGGWNCYLRYSINGMLAESGFGETLGEAIFDALRKARASGHPNRALPEPKRHETAAGQKTDAELTAYASPAAAQWPKDLGKPDEDLGVVPVEASDVGADDFDVIGEAPASSDDDLSDFF